MDCYDGPTIPIRQGDHNSGRFTVKNKVTGVVEDLTNWVKFWFIAKRSLSDTDALAVFEVSTPAGGMTVTLPLVGVVDYEVEPAATTGLGVTEQMFWYDFQGLDPFSRVKTILSGRIEYCPQVKIGVV